MEQSGPSYGETQRDGVERFGKAAMKFCDSLMLGRLAVRVTSTELHKYVCRVTANVTRPNHKQAMICECSVVAVRIVMLSNAQRAPGKASGSPIGKLIE